MFIVWKSRHFKQYFNIGFCSNENLESNSHKCKCNLNNFCLNSGNMSVTTYLQNYILPSSSYDCSLFFPLWEWLISNFHPSFLSVPSTSGVPRLTGNTSLNTNCVVIISKHLYVWIVTSPANFSLAEPFRQNIFHTFLEKELGCFNNWVGCYLEPLVCLPWQKHTTSSISSVVARSVKGALFPIIQILYKLDRCQSISENFLSISRDIVSWFSQSSLHFLYVSFRGAGSFQMPIPFVFRHDPQPTTEQLSPGIVTDVFQ